MAHPLHTYILLNNKIELLTEYESVTQKVLFGIAVLAALMSENMTSYLKMVFLNKVRYQNAMSLQNSVWKKFTFR
jgi:hypothetical protein